MNDKATSDTFAELDAMKQIAGALAELDNAAVARVLRWASDRYNTPVLPTAPETSEMAVSGKSGAHQFGDLADLYSATSPQSDPDRALVTAYWFQIVQGDRDFDSQRINKELKNLGHGVSNITQAFSSLIRRKPQLVIQTKKAGTSMQARKRYRLTTVGQQAVEQMIGNHQEF